MAPKVERQPARFMHGIFDAAGDEIDGGGGAPVTQAVRTVQSNAAVELLATDAGNVVFISGTADSTINLSAIQSALVPTGGVIEVCFYNPSFIDAAITIPGAAIILNGGMDQSVRAGTTVKLRKIQGPLDPIGLEIWSMTGGDFPLPLVTVADAGKTIKIVDIGVAALQWQSDLVE